jgi:hypothetical protein
MGWMTRSRGRRITGTDEKGGYVFTDVAPGDYQVTFELAGYTSKVVHTVSVKFDKDSKDSKDDDKEGDKDGGRHSDSRNKTRKKR